jgi:transposase-like protein
VFARTTVQTCIVHLIRNSLAFVSWKDRKTIMPDIKAIYRAETAEAAAARLDEFEAKWGERYPAIAPGWRRAWEHVVPMFAFPPAIRKMIYTTNALESLHRSLRKIIKTRGSFPNDAAAMKLLFLAIRNAGVHWRRPVEWTAAMGQLYPSGRGRGVVGFVCRELAICLGAGYAAKVSAAWVVFQFQGRSSSRRRAGWSAMRASTSASQA